MLVRKVDLWKWIHRVLLLLTILKGLYSFMPKFHSEHTSTLNRITHSMINVSM